MFVTNLVQFGPPKFGSKSEMFFHVNNDLKNKVLMTLTFDLRPWQPSSSFRSHDEYLWRVSWNPSTKCKWYRVTNASIQPTRERTENPKT